ncbi:SLATT domain-containing protein [Pseudomonas taiwanensis]|uniref:SLATT domain-containing protein n=1 Tax=Pseudomonas taiwanensis TaxID=470150 RepID=UPI0016441648|nr:SLATT domain-containing protein [Pseudomonas taiwanensis]MBC3493600.1 DUF4231 domain-containing protein [Pseudomonas taiwanensis]
MPSNYSPPQNPKELIERWNKRARESQFGHYHVSDKLHSRNLYLGLSIIIITSLNGIANLVSSPPKELTIVLGALSLVATFLTSLQTFFKYEERSIQHRTAAAKYGCSRRTMEQLLSFPTPPTQQQADKIRESLDALSADSPNVSKSELAKALHGE